MGFLEKLKNTFFEEEYVEIEEKPPVVKKEVVKRQVVEKEIDAPKPEVIRREKEVIKEVVQPEREVPKVVKEEVVHPVREEVPASKEVTRRERFNYFDDEDFLDMSDDYYRSAEVRKPEKKVQEVERVTKAQPKLYDNPSYASKKPSTINSGSSPYQKDAREGFRPTPIISPIYGILDKNYTKEEIKVEKKEPSSYVSRKNVDLDSVREKAYGSFTSEYDLVGNVKDERVRVNSFDDEDDNADLDIDDNLLYDMTDINKTPTVDKVTLQDAEEYFQDLGLEYNIDYKDARHEKVTGRRVSKTPQLEKLENMKEFVVDSPVEEDEIIFTKTEESQTRSNQRTSLEDNLFDLIDSMYEEKE